MANLKSGKSSTEWWTICAVVGLAAAKMFGLVPEDASVESVAKEGTEALPALINGVTELVKENGGLLVVSGLAWAYLKRRTGLKIKETVSKVPIKRGGAPLQPPKMS